MQPEKSGWFDKKNNLVLFLRLFYASLIGLLILDFFIPKHSVFGFDGVPDFFAAYGFLSCVMLVLGAKVLRKFTRKDENYYDN